jgi:hypothetical protein
LNDFTALAGSLHELLQQYVRFTLSTGDGVHHDPNAQEHGSNQEQHQAFDLLGGAGAEKDYKTQATGQQT